MADESESKTKTIGASVPPSFKQALEPYVDHYGTESVAVRHLVRAGLRERFHVQTIFLLIGGGDWENITSAEPELERAFYAGLGEQINREGMGRDWVETAESVGVELEQKELKALYRVQRGDFDRQDVAAVANLINRVTEALAETAVQGDTADLGGGGKELVEQALGGDNDA